MDWLIGAAIIAVFFAALFIGSWLISRELD